MQIGKNYKATTEQFINPFVFSASSFYSGHIRLHISNLTIARIAVLGICDLERRYFPSSIVIVMVLIGETTGLVLKSCKRTWKPGW